MEHVKFHVNQPRPRGKAKYYCVTDSETVPRGKGEKNPARGVKQNMKPQAYKQWEDDSSSDRVPVEE
jgi:hypothetical protein